MPMAQLNKVKLSYNTTGNGFPIVFISGLGVDRMCWIYQVVDFQQHFKVIVFDNRGIGKSQRSVGPYSIRMMADDVAELIHYLKINKAHVVGTSMGGMIAQELAINYPGIVEKLVLCSTFAKPYDTIELITKGIREIVNEEVKNIFNFNPKKLLFEKLFDYLLLQIFSESYIKENRYIIEKTLREYLSNITYAETFIKQLAAIHKHNTVDRLNQISAETLVLTGTCDKLVPHECSDTLAKYITNSHLFKIDCGEHGMHFENPEQFNKIVIDYLSSKTDKMERYFSAVSE
jgi:pimeloyl-ACP methyl ester carboxylesterase